MWYALWLALMIYKIQPVPVQADIKPFTALEAPFLPIESPEIAITATSTASTTEDSLIAMIATCESRNDPKAKNPHSSASGRFQFIKGTWEHYGKEFWGDEWIDKDVFDYEDNTELATWVINKYGTNDWLESKSCWGKIKS